MRRGLLLAALPLLSGAATPDDGLAVATTYEFVPATYTYAKSGTAKTLGGRAVTACQNPVKPGTNDVVGDVAAVILKGGSTCWTSDQYSNGDYPIEPGTAKGEGETFPAYKISPPKSKASSFVSSGTGLYVRMTKKENLDVYLLTAGSASKVSTVTAPDTVGSDVWVYSGYEIHKLTSDALVVLVPASKTVLERRVLKAADATDCMSSIPKSAGVGNMTVVTTKSNDRCWTDGRYNNDEVLVELGVLQGADGSKHKAYRINPPQVKKKEFAASMLNIRLRHDAAETLIMHWFDPARQQAGFVQSEVAFKADGSFVSLGRDADDLVSPMIVVPLKIGQRLSIWPRLAPGVDGVWLGGETENGGHSVTVRRFDVSTTDDPKVDPFVPEDNWRHGPGTHTGNYQTPKRFFGMLTPKGLELVIWQDQTAHNVFATTLGKDLKSSTTKRLYKGRDILMAAVGDGGKTDNVVLLMVNEKRGATTSTPTSAKLMKVNAQTGALVKESSLDTSKGGLNIYSWDSPGASAAWNVGAKNIGFTLSRTMLKADDGLNHQGAINFVADADSLAVIKNHGQSSGHSIGNSLTLAASGDYVGMDVGDNYPRGINMQDFTKDKRTTKVVYEFKTKHSTIAGGYPVYSEISDSTTTYYKWSNDNYVYTELAHPGIVEADDGYMIFFAGEKPALDNSKVGQPMNTPRNVGFTKIPKDMSSTKVLSPGAKETGGYYTFGGSWRVQENEGISFLTDFAKMDEAVSRLKTARLGKNKNLLLWEQWSAKEHQGAMWMVVDDSGKTLTGPTKSGYSWQFPIQDDPMIKSGRVVQYVGTHDGRLARYEVCVQDKCPSRKTATTNIGKVSEARMLSATTAFLFAFVTLLIQ